MAKRRFKSSTINTGGSPLVAADVTASMRAEDNYQRANEQRQLNALQQNNKYLAEDSKKMQLDLAQRQKDLEQWHESIIDDAGGMWDHLAQFSPTLGKLAAAQAKKVEAESGSFDEMQAATDYFRRGGLSDEAKELKAAMDSEDGTNAAVGAAARDEAEKGHTAAAGKLISYVSHRSLEMGRQNFLREAASMHPQAVQEILRSDDKLVIVDPKTGSKIETTFAEAWLGDNMAAARYALSVAHRKATSMLGVSGGGHTVAQLELAGWFETTSKNNAALLKSKSQDAYEQRSEAKKVQMVDELQAALLSGDMEALNRFDQEAAGLASKEQGRAGLGMSGREIQEFRRESIAALYALDKVKRHQIMAAYGAKGYFLSNKGASFADYNENQMALLAEELDRIDTRNTAKAKAEREAEMEKKKQAFLNSVRDENGYVDLRAAKKSKTYRELVLEYPELRQELDTTLQADSLQQEAIDRLFDNAEQAMANGSFTQNDFDRLPPRVQLKIEQSGLWTNYKKDKLDPFISSGAQQTAINATRKAFKFADEKQAADFDHRAKMLQRAIDLEIHRVAESLSKSIPAEERYRQAADQVTEMIRGINGGNEETRDTESPFFFSSEGGAPNIHKYYGGYTTGEQARNRDQRRLDKLDPNKGGSVNAWKSVNFYGATTTEGKAFITKMLNDYSKAPGSYQPTFFFQRLGVLNNKRFPELLNELAPLVGHPGVPDPLKDNALWTAIPQSQIDRIDDKYNCATETSARLIGKACNATGEQLWKQGVHAPAIEAKFEGEDQLYAGGLVSALQFSAQRNGTMAMGGNKTVNQTFDQWNLIKQDYPNQIEQYPDLKRKLESYQNMDPASLFAVVSLMSGLGPERLTEMSSAALSDNLSTYGRFAYRATGDKRFLDLTKYEQRRNLGPVVSDTQVSQSLGAKAGDQLAYYPKPVTATQIQKLNTIGKYESDSVGGYNAVNQIGTKKGHGTLGHSGPFGDMDQHKGKFLTEMTVGEIMELQARRSGMSNEEWIRQGRLHAVGRYQFTRDTFASLVKRMGIPLTAKFDHRTQDAMALQLYDERKMSPWVGVTKRGIYE